MQEVSLNDTSSEFIVEILSGLEWLVFLCLILDLYFGIVACGLLLCLSRGCRLGGGGAGSLSCLFEGFVFAVWGRFS